MEIMSDVVYFYILRDPMSREVCYVGQTTDPDRRYKQHISHPQIPYMYRWVYGLRKKNLLPILEIIEKSDMQHDYYFPCKKEKELIDKYWNYGCPLLNASKRHKGWGTRMRNSETFKNADYTFNGE